MLSIVKEDYLHKAKEAFLEGVEKVLEKPKTSKEKAKILRQISPHFHMLMKQYEDSIDKLKQTYKEYRWEQKGNAKIHKDAVKQIGMLIEKNNLLIKENRTNKKTIAQLSYERDKAIKKSNRLENRLYNKWYKLRDWLIKRTKNIIKRYVKKKNVQILKLKKKVQR